MTPDEIVEFVTGLGGTIVVVASEENGNPEMAWGDTYFFYDPDGVTVPEKRMPFATIVVNDYPGFDEASNLSRPGVFRVNVSVSRDTWMRSRRLPTTSAARCASRRITSISPTRSH